MNYEYFVKNYPELITNDNITKEWKDLMLEVFRECEEDISNLNKMLKEERESGVNWLPGRSNVWAFTRFCPPENIKIVIVGQDPSPIPEHATGVAFSSDNLALSTAVVLKEAGRDITDSGGQFVPFPQNYGCLKNWCEQGVLLLNSALTVSPVIAGSPAASHRNLGWEEVVIAIINQLWNKIFKEKSITIYMLWGYAAKSLRSKLKTDRVEILESYHPSVRNQRGSFILETGERGHFSTANLLLKKNGLAEINWSFENK